MAASKAPDSAATATALFPLTDTTSFSTTTTTTISNTTTLNTSLLASNINCDNINDLCRSCGKTNDELYDLFQQQTTNLVTAANNNSNANSPFNTSSTTCYTHLTSKTTAVAVGCEKSSPSTTTFDSLAATAKATAKGQSNMDNILQEMQIWQLMIKFNDGLPQRICAKCTAQFYMIHKFRRKCLKVQTQLRTLYEEQQQQQEQQQQHEQPQQQSCEYLSEKDATIEPTSTPQIDIVTPPPLPSTVPAHRDNDIAENSRTNEQEDELLKQEQHVIDNEQPSVSFETQTASLDNRITVEAVLPKDERKPLAFESGSQLPPSAQHVCDKELKPTTSTEAVTENASSSPNANICVEDKNEETTNNIFSTLQSNELPNLKDSKQVLVNLENVFVTKAALKAYTTNTINSSICTTNLVESRQTKNNDSNDNVCSSTSNLVSPSCSSTTTSTSTPKTKRTEINSRSRRKRLNSKTNSSLLSLKQKTVVFKNKKKLKSNRRCRQYKFKRLTTDVKANSPPTKSTSLRWSRSTQSQRVKKHKTRHKQKRQMKTDAAIQMADESSSSVDSTTSTVSTSSSSSSSSTLSSSAVTNHPHKTASSKWKTKAAMKANANDLPHSELQQKQSTASTTGLNSTTTSSLPSSPSLSIANYEEENQSLKTPNEDHVVSDNNTTTTTNNSNNNNNNNTTTSSQHLFKLKFKDQHQESLTNENKQQQQPEGEEQKQIEMNTTQHSVNDQKTIEIPPANANNEEEQQPIVVTTPPAKTGCMKLILQRKRGTRFTCRPKNASDNDDEEQLQATTSKRRRKTLSSLSFSTLDSNKKVHSFSSSSTSLNSENDNNLRNFEEITVSSDKMLRDRDRDHHHQQDRHSNEADENKENPALHEYQQELDADSDLSSYRDPLLIRNDINEDDTNLTDFPQNQLVASLHTECSKEMFKTYKEKVKLESPKKLIVRVPLTSLTQDFKRLHLTIENQQVLDEEKAEEETQQQDIPMTSEIQEEEENPLPLSTSQNSNENTENQSGGSDESDLLGFSQSNDDSPTSSSSLNSSTQQSIEVLRYIQPPLCSASSKINDFINDFQNNCIDSSEIEDSNEATLPHLTSCLAQELSDEIRDVEDTLNGILSEMHDKDMYTPRSGTTDEFFAHSVYSPLTDAPTTPANSFYAESPCTMNSNPMSVSPFIQPNMDYNAMTPQSNHSSMGHGSHMSVGSNQNNGCFREHFPSYKECFEESTQSELIGFQNDIPCFENIELGGNAETAEDLLAQTAEVNEESVNANLVPESEQEEEEAAENIEPRHQPEIVDYIDLSDYKESNEESVAEIPVATAQIVTPHIAYNPATFQHPTQNPIQSATSSLISTTTQPHYIVTNTSQGPLLISSQGQEQMEAAFKPHSNNLQFITLGQAMEANRRMSTNHLIGNQTTTELNWPTTAEFPSNYQQQQQQQQQPVLTTATNGTTTYFINANGELYQASIPTTTMQNAILVPSNPSMQNPTTSYTFNRTNNDTNENYMQRANTATAPSSQYIMLVNGVTGAPQYFATNTALNQAPMAAATNITPPAPATVVYQQTPQTTIASNLTGNYVSSCPNLTTNNANTTSLSSDTTETSSNTRKPTTPVPITPALTPSTDNSNQSMHQKINLQLQRQIKERQQQLLHPRSPGCAQKITLICRFCHKRPKFTNNVDYSNHIINTHPAENPYNCPHCPTNFRRRLERQEHVAQVHGSRYQCAQCGLSFCAQRTLDFHLQKYHANLGLTQTQQQNSNSTVTAPATYQLLQQNQQQRLVRVEDVHVQMTDENKNKRSIDLPLESADVKASPLIQESNLLSGIDTASSQGQQSRKLCCPDCKGDNDNCCGSSNQNRDPKSQQLKRDFVGNESAKDHHNNYYHQQQQEQSQTQPQPQSQHVTIPSPEQTEPDSTTTLRHFRKRQLSEKSSCYTPILSSSTTSSSSTTTNSNSSGINANNDNSQNATAFSSSNLTGDEGVEHQQQQIVVKRTLRGAHNCLLCEESFTNEIALRKHHHLAHGTQIMATTNATTLSSSASLVCTICKRGFRMRIALQRHMETHDAEGRPYECNICQVRFPRPSQLTLHKLTVHKFEKTISCEECGKQFGTESAMKAHTKLHEEAAKASTIEAKTASSTSAVAVASSTSLPTQFSSRIYLDTMTTITASASNLKASVSAAAITTITTTTATKSVNEQNINLQSTTSGESTTTRTDAVAVAAAADVCNNQTQNAIVASELTR